MSTIEFTEWLFVRDRIGTFVDYSSVRNHVTIRDNESQRKDKPNQMISTPLYSIS